MTIKRGLSSRGRLEVERRRGAGGQGEERLPPSLSHSPASFLVCPRAVFPRYIIYFERVHLKNWLSRVRV